jgi:hypothetical protein
MQVSAQHLELPGMRMIRRRVSVLPEADVPAEIEREWSDLKDRIEFPLNGRVAVAVGSRGISNLTQVVRTVVMKLKEAGCDPFIVPAMGSHGGATASGQVEVLSAREAIDAALVTLRPYGLDDLRLVIPLWQVPVKPWSPSAPPEAGKPRRPPSLPLICRVFPAHSSFSVFGGTPMA